MTTKFPTSLSGPHHPCRLLGHPHGPLPRGQSLARPGPIAALTSLNCVPRKTFVISVPSIPTSQSFSVPLCKKCQGNIVLKSHIPGLVENFISAYLLSVYCTNYFLLQSEVFPGSPPEVCFVLAVFLLSYVKNKPGARNVKILPNVSQVCRMGCLCRCTDTPRSRQTPSRSRTCTPRLLHARKGKS